MQPSFLANHCLTMGLYCLVILSKAENASQVIKDSNLTIIFILVLMGMKVYLSNNNNKFPE